MWMLLLRLSLLTLATSAWPDAVSLAELSTSAFHLHAHTHTHTHRETHSDIVCERDRQVFRCCLQHLLIILALLVFCTLPHCTRTLPSARVSVRVCVVCVWFVYCTHTQSAHGIRWLKFFVFASHWCFFYSQYLHTRTHTRVHSSATCQQQNWLWNDLLASKTASILIKVAAFCSAVIPLRHFLFYFLRSLALHSFPALGPTWRMRNAASSMRFCYGFYCPTTLTI